MNKLHKDWNHIEKCSIMIELTNSLRKTVASLGDVAHRRAEGLFKAEGTKCVLDTAPHFAVRYLLATDGWLSAHDYRPVGADVVKCIRRDMERMSSLSTAPDVIAVMEIPQWTVDMDEPSRNLVIAVDSLQDPGNLGTIVRVADWFGVREVVCSKGTVDVFNPKTVQATMGALARVKVVYCDLPETLNAISRNGVEVCGTFLDGENIYRTSLPRNGVIVVGNEGRGISDDVSGTVTRRLTIPSYPEGEATSESLNAAVATAITVAAFRQQCFSK